MIDNHTKKEIVRKERAKFERKLKLSHIPKPDPHNLPLDNWIQEE